MITKTSLLAVRALLCLAKDQQRVAVPPRSIAHQLGESPAYMAKVLRSLVKAGLLRAEHGSKGGVHLNKRPAEITLLSIIQACQGTIVGSYCEEVDDIETVCAFHRAATELQEAITDVLSHWTLEQLARSPSRRKCLPGGKQCMMPVFPISPGAPAKRRQV